jgi:hypothetical protein
MGLMDGQEPQHALHQVCFYRDVLADYLVPILVSTWSLPWARSRAITNQRTNHSL